jgi:hypothetical protein
LRAVARITSTTLPAFDDGRHRAPGAPPRHDRAASRRGDRRPIADGITSSRHHHVQRDCVTTAAGEMAMGLALSGAGKGAGGATKEKRQKLPILLADPLDIGCHNLPWFRR